MKELKDPETAIHAEGNHMSFNKQDCTKEADEMAGDYIKGNFMYLGWRFGKTLVDHSKAPPSVKVDPPIKDYFDKMGARFAGGYLAGTNVGDFDEIDLYECIRKEPEAFMLFVKGDELLKRSLVEKDPSLVVPGLTEILNFVVEMVLEDYPHTKYQVCKEFSSKHSDAKWDDLKRIMGELKT